MIAASTTAAGALPLPTPEPASARSVSSTPIDASQAEGVFTALYTTYYRLVRTHLACFTQDGDLADELAQETFLRLWRAMLRQQVWIATQQEIRGYLLRIATNLALDAVRSWQQRLRAACISLDSDLEHGCGENAPLLARIEQAMRDAGDRESTRPPDVLVCERCAFEELSTCEQEVLRRFLTGEKLKEIAVRVGLSKSHTGRLLEHAARHVYAPPSL